MGSQTVTAVTEQRGSLKTNPSDLTPDTSRPILQIGELQVSSLNIIEQKGPFETAGEDPSPDFSAPIEQRKGAQFSEIDGEPDDTVILQAIATSANSPVSEDNLYEGPVEQFEKKVPQEDKPPGDSELIVQELIERNENTAEPVEQKPPVTNNINVQQADIIDLIFPPCGSIKNAVDSDILWRINDLGFPFDTSTLIFRVNGVPVQDSSNFSTTDLGTGIQIDYDPPDDFEFGTTVEIFLEISDTADPPNNFNLYCTFDTVPDTLPPIVSNVNVCDQENVSVTQTVEFDILDTGRGVDADSIILNIEGIPVCSGITLDGITVPGSGTGFHVTWEHEDDPFRFGYSISLAVEASDLANNPNRVLFVCCFDTEESNAPTFHNFDPEQCSSFIDTETGLQFEVYGLEHGVDISTLEVRVDNQLRKVFVRPRILRSQ